MPYQPDPDSTDHHLLLRLVLWPYRSLPRRGFVLFIGGTATLIALPLVTLLGRSAFWGLLPFLALAVAGVWLALSRSYRDGQHLEILSIWPDRIELVRRSPGTPERRWTDNPYWVRVILHETGGPVPNYLTLKGQSREVEIGAFLSEAERIALRRDLTDRLAQLR